MAINVLPENIANQIAAGEVVNRPASAVKELLENAVDAQADAVTLIICDAGRTLVEVIDNGCGMDEQDAQKCFLPHATSKISNENDLRNLTTMGFRGEALASVAAIAQVELRTKRENCDLAEEIVIEGGEIKSVSKTTAPKGTDIRVKNIFFNVPARRNFLKSDQVESSHINEAFIRIALINPHISFTYIRDSHTVYKLEKATFRKRITDIFGNQFNKNLLEVKEKIDLVEIEGFISTVDLTRKSKNDQYFFVNKRYMKNPYFANAVERAYTSLIPPKTFPAFFLHLKVNPKNIDVNIHPTKTEVKFIDDKIIYSVLHSAVRKSLGQNTLSNTLSFEKQSIEFPSANVNHNFQQPKLSYNRSFNPFAKTNANTSFDATQKINNVKVQTEISFNGSDIQNDNTPMPNDISNLQGITFQFLNKYIVTQRDNSLLLINQFKASKRIIYDFLCGKTSLILPKEKLLLPYTHKFSPIEIISLKSQTALLQNIGFEFSINDDNSVDFSAMPKDMTALAAMNIVEDVIDEQIHLNDKLIVLAECLAIKEGKILTTNEMQSLIKQLFQVENPEFLPMNERVFLKLDNDFLHKFFF